MAGSVNKVILVGNLGRDPEIRSFQNGGRVANLSLATSENWKDKRHAASARKAPSGTASPSSTTGSSRSPRST